MSDITSIIHPLADIKHNLDEEQKSDLQAMVDLMDGEDLKAFLRKTTPKYHIGKIIDGKLEELDIKEYIMHQKLNYKINEQWCKCPGNMEFFDFNEFLSENLLSIYAYAPRRTEGLAQILIKEIRKKCVGIGSRGAKADRIKRSNEVQKCRSLFPDTILPGLVYLYYLYHSFLPEVQEQSVLEKRLTNFRKCVYTQISDKEKLMEWLNEFRLLIKLNKQFNPDVGLNIRAYLPSDFIDHQMRIKKELKEKMLNSDGEERKALNDRLINMGSNEKTLQAFEIFFEERDEKDVKVVNNVITNYHCDYHPSSSSHNTSDCRNPGFKRKNDDRAKRCSHHPKSKSHDTTDCYIEKKRPKASGDKACNICAELGHLSMACPKKEKMLEEKARLKRENPTVFATSSFKGVCFRCGERDSHTLANCPVKMINVLKEKETKKEEKGFELVPYEPAPVQQPYDGKMDIDFRNFDNDEKADAEFLNSYDL
eukprot:Awhi_evm1s1195